MNILMVGPHKDKIKGGISTAIKSYSESEFLQEFNIYNLHTVSVGNKLNKIFYCIYSILKMMYYLVFKKIDLIHIHTASGNSFIRKSIFVRIGSFFNKKILLHIHGGGFEDFYKEKLSLNKNSKISNILDKCSYIIVLSDGWEKKLKNMTSSKIIVISNSVEAQKINHYDLLSKQITFIGRVEEEKGIYDFIESARDIISDLKDIKFTICGGGDLENIKSIILNYGIEDKFNILGWVDRERIQAELKKSMIFVLPSHKEAMPISILEAMSYGVPIISTKVGSIPEFIKEGENGELFNPKDINSLTILIKKLIESKGLRRIYSEKNFTDIKINYSNKITHEKIKNLYFSSNTSRRMK